MDTTDSQKIDRWFFLIGGVIKDIEDDANLDINEWFDICGMVSKASKQSNIMSDQQKVEFSNLRNRFEMVSNKIIALNLENPFESIE